MLKSIERQFNSTPTIYVLELLSKTLQSSPEGSSKQVQMVWMCPLIISENQASFTFYHNPYSIPLLPSVVLLARWRLNVSRRLDVSRWHALPNESRYETLRKTARRNNREPLLRSWSLPSNFSTIYFVDYPLLVFGIFAGIFLWRAIALPITFEFVPLRGPSWIKHYLRLPWPEQSASFTWAN